MYFYEIILISTKNKTKIGRYNNQNIVIISFYVKLHYDYILNLLFYVFFLLWTLLTTTKMLLTLDVNSVSIFQGEKPNCLVFWEIFFGFKLNNHSKTRRHWRKQTNIIYLSSTGRQIPDKAELRPPGGHKYPPSVWWPLPLVTRWFLGVRTCGRLEFLGNPARI